MAISARNSLNPNADPFLCGTPSLTLAKTESVPGPMPIFNLSHQHSQWKTSMIMQPQSASPSQVVAWSPVHGYVYYNYVEPTSRWQYQHTVSGCYVVNSHTWWPFSAGFGGMISQQDNSIGCREMKVSCDLRRIAKMGSRRSTRRQKIEMKTEPREMSVVDEAFLLSPIPGEVVALETTTVMIKNIPNQFRRRDLLNILDEHCRLENTSSDHNFGSDPFWSEYDFVYLPMDFRRFWFERKISNLGYAFVNFTSAAAASKFCKVYHRREWKVTVNKKVCEVTRAKIQGIKALGEAFKNKIFWCHSNQYLPVTLEPPSDGCRRYKAISIGKRVAVIPPKPMKKCG